MKPTRWFGPVFVALALALIAGGAMFVAPSSQAAPALDRSPAASGPSRPANANSPQGAPTATATATARRARVAPRPLRRPVPPDCRLRPAHRLLSAADHIPGAHRHLCSVWNDSCNITTCHSGTYDYSFYLYNYCGADDIEVDLTSKWRRDSMVPGRFS